MEVTYRTLETTQRPGTSASLTSDYPVLASRATTTPHPVSRPRKRALARELNEGEKGMAVGAPVTATDDGPGKLNYTLTMVAQTWPNSRLTRRPA